MKTLQPFDLTTLEMTDYYFIAHLLDRVLVGRVNEDSHKLLLEAIRQNTVLEVHFFNEEKEIFVTRFQDKLVAYTPLEHKEGPEKGVITRSYRLEEKFRDFRGTLKPLGAWGGDLALVVSQENEAYIRGYFAEKGFDTLLPWPKIIDLPRNILQL